MHTTVGRIQRSRLDDDLVHKRSSSKKCSACMCYDSYEYNKRGAPRTRIPFAPRSWAGVTSAPPASIVPTAHAGTGSNVLSPKSS